MISYRIIKTNEKDQFQQCLAQNHKNANAYTRRSVQEMQAPIGFDVM